WRGDGRGAGRDQRGRSPHGPRGGGGGARPRTAPDRRLRRPRRRRQPPSRPAAARGGGPAASPGVPVGALGPEAGCPPPRPDPPGAAAAAEAVSGRERATARELSPCDDGRVTSSPERTGSP